MHTTTLMREAPIYWEHGLHFAKLSRSRSRIFTNEIRYNLAGMAIEKLVMGFLMRINQLPEGHTLRDLMDAVETLASLPSVLCARIRAMDDFQQICAFDTYTRTVPDDREMAEMETLVTDLLAELDARRTEAAA